MFLGFAVPLFVYFGTVVGGFGCGLVSVAMVECGWLVVVFVAFW